MGVSMTPEPPLRGLGELLALKELLGNTKELERLEQKRKEVNALIKTYGSIASIEKDSAEAQRLRAEAGARLKDAEAAAGGMMADARQAVREMKADMEADIAGREESVSKRENAVAMKETNLDSRLQALVVREAEVEKRDASLREREAHISEMKAFYERKIEESKKLWN